MSLKASNYEKEIAKALEHVLDRESHSYNHLQTVLQFAKQLGEKYGADMDILTASVLLNDLGRNDKTIRDEDSAKESAVRAEVLLKQIHFPLKKAKKVLTNIEQHDQHSVEPTYIEGKILKDADFLAGFGALGIVRAAILTGETKGSMNEFLERIGKKMPLRIQSLIFPESRLYATKEFVFVKLFYDRLTNFDMQLPQKGEEYIVIEGIDGAGKSTQVDLLKEHFTKKGKEVITVHEPSSFFDEKRDYFKQHKLDEDNVTKTLLYLLDRYVNFRPIISSSLKEGKIVVADRSFISTIVYQGEEGWLTPANIAYLHTLVIQPTKMIILDLDPNVGYERVMSRYKESQKKISEYETIEKLSECARKLKELVTIFPYVKIIDVNGLTPMQVHKEVLQAIEN